MGLRAANRRRILTLAGFALAGATVGCLGDDEEPRRPRDVTFDAARGSTVEGTLYGDGACGVVLIPQIDRERTSWKEQAERFARRGRHVLAIDVDADDRSGSVRGAIRYMRDAQDVDRLVLVGASVGGRAAVIANAHAPSGTVDGTVTLSASGGVDHAPDLQGRLLFVISEREHEKYVRIGRELHAAAPEPKELVAYDGDDHAQRLFSGDRGDDVRRLLREFVADACD
ncbi:dienelactone hydrolase family protein [Halegenticoccus tardaugens]|uniref:dienelactone hydrolase family protein n=1 Tax=Halegenticoccus tardaugens TaxID=2071624 RepID=UPI00100BCA02|nr:hypothetical protein [Halegenticoccus tardaugens]